MMLKITILMTLVVVMVQLSVSSNEENTRVLEDPPLEDVVEELRKNLTNLVVAHEAMLKRLDIDVSSIVKSMVVQAKKRVKFEFLNMLHTLQGIKDRGKDLQLNVSTCLEDKEELLTSLLEKYSDQIDVCGFSKEGKFILLFGEHEVAIKLTINEVEDYRKALKRCDARPATAAYCRALNGIALYHDSVTLPVWISKHSAEGLRAVDQLRVAMAKCSGRVVDSLLYEGNDLLSDIMICVVDQIKSRKSGP